jgi:hypothetical protein
MLDDAELLDGTDGAGAPPLIFAFAAGWRVTTQPSGDYRKLRSRFSTSNGTRPGKSIAASHPDFTQELPRKLLPTRAKEPQSYLRQKR